MRKPKLFISHSSKDSECVNSFIDFLLKAGMKPENLLCSSCPYTKIAIRVDINEELRNLLSNDNVYVIYFLSDNYYMSPVCLNEMGATWISKAKSLSFLLPGFDFSDMRGVVNKNAVGIRLLPDDEMTKASFNEFKKDLKDFFKLSIDDTRWELARDEFLASVPESPRKLNMTLSKSYCIGDAYNDGCEIIHKESNDHAVVANLDFDKTQSEMSSIVVFPEIDDFRFYLANNRTLRFEACAYDGMDSMEVEFKLDGFNTSERVSLSHDENGYYIPLKQICSVMKRWQKVHEICFLFTRKHTSSAGKVMIKNLRIE